MTDLGDRILVLIVVATGLAGLFGWVGGTFLEVSGTELVLAWVVLMVAYFLVLLGVWQLFKRVDTQPQ